MLLFNLKIKVRKRTNTLWMTASITEIQESEDVSASEAASEVVSEAASQAEPEDEVEDP